MAQRNSSKPNFKAIDRLVRSLPAPTKGNKVYGESALRERGLNGPWVRGLGVRVTTKGTATWIFDYYANRIERQYTIGDIEAWPAELAWHGQPAPKEQPERALRGAVELRRMVDAGRDPVLEERAKDAAAQRKHGSTVTRLLETYATAVPKREKQRGHGKPSPRYVAEEMSQLRLAIDVLGIAKKQASDLTADTLKQWLADGDNLRARFGALSRFLDWCHDNGHIAANPCDQIARARRPKAHQSRSNYLRPTELGCLWRGAERLQEPVCRDFAQFLIAVPCRLREAANLDWSHISLSAAEWRQPDKTTKNDEPHRFHLAALAQDILRKRREATGGRGLVFPGPRTGGVLSGFTGMKNALSDAADIRGWTWHDFRRSFASALGEAGIPEVIADAVLNHRQSATCGGVLGVYQRSSRWPEQVKAMTLWGRLLTAAIEGREDDNVVPLATLAG
jgi:integrase